jgi:predicted nucleic acid-binding protein
MSAVVLDSSVVIALLSTTDTLHQAAVLAVAEREAAGCRILVPAVGWAEVFTGAVRRGSDGVAAVRAFRDLVVNEVVPADEQIAEEAARLRAADMTLRLPDALVVATGMCRAAEAVLTGDKRLARVDDRVRVVQGVSRQ